MRPKASITIEEIVRLKAQGWSLQRIANHAGVSRSTIKNRLRRERPDRDPAVMAFATMLEQIAAEAPNDLCGREVRRVVHALRTKVSLSREAFKNEILETLEPGVWRDGQDIADGIGIPFSYVSGLLSEMVDSGILRRISPGGVLNRGRRTKFFYLKVS